MEEKEFTHPPFPRMQPEDMTVHMLISEISKVTHDTVRRKNEQQLSLPMGYGKLIFHLAHCDGITQLDLSRTVRLTPPTVSIALRKMETAGYVTRTADCDDLRQTKVFLTEKGRQIDEGIRDSFKAIDEQSVKGLSDEEKATLKSLLIKVRANVIPERKWNDSNETV